MQQSKLEQIREAWRCGDQIAALRIASRFHDRSDETRLFERGMQAHLHPEFFRQVGKIPEALTDEALRVLAVKFRLGP